MTQNEVLRISEPVEKLYMDCASQLLINLCRHFKTDKALASREWEIKKLSELGALTEESIEIIAANTGVAPEQIKNAVSDALKTELSSVENTLASAAKKGLISGPATSFEASENVRIVLNNLVEQAVKDSNIVNTVMLESVRNQYLFAINNTLAEEQAEIERMQNAANLVELDAQLQATQQALNASTFSVASGAESRTAALRRTIKQLTDQGITGYIDAGGHKWSPEAYINMDIRTTVHNAAVQGQQARSADYKVTTFLVSSHSGARPLCYPYQGKVYSWDGSEGTVYDLDGNAYHYESVHNTSYGQAAGLFGINCGHSPLTFVDGYTVPRLSPPEDEEENARIYKESQQQRAIEREIRGAKTEALAYQAAGDTEGFDKASMRVKKYNAEYKDFCKRTGRTERTDRTQVYGYNRSTAAKARAAAKDYTPTLKGPAAPIVPAVTKAKTYEEAVDSIKAIGFEKIDNSVYNINKDAFVAITNRLDSLDQRFKVIKNAGNMQLGTSDGKELGAFIRSGNERGIALQRQLFHKSADKIMESTSQYTKSGFWMPIKDSAENKLSYIITHEYGHALHYSLAPSGTAEHEMFRVEILNLALDIAPEFKKGDASYNMLIGNIPDSGIFDIEEKYISKYGKSNSDEFFAEAFANSQLGAPNLIGRAMQQWLEKRGF